MSNGVLNSHAARRAPNTVSRGHGPPSVARCRDPFRHTVVGPLARLSVPKEYSRGAMRCLNFSGCAELRAGIWSTMCSLASWMMGHLSLSSVHRGLIGHCQDDLIK